MAKVLILFAHPALEKSRVHAQLVQQISSMEGITFHDLYESYPDLEIDIKKEQQLLMEHQIIALQHPFYWYSAPPVIKQWLDLVLEHGWAYGSEGNMLAGKTVFNIISCGGSREAYSRKGRNRFTIREFLVPFEQTAFLCNMQYWPPFVVHGTHKLDETSIKTYAGLYRQMLIALVNNSIDHQVLQSTPYFNDIMSFSQSFQIM